MFDIFKLFVIIKKNCLFILLNQDTINLDIAINYAVTVFQ